MKHWTSLVVIDQQWKTMHTWDLNFIRPESWNDKGITGCVYQSKDLLRILSYYLALGDLPKTMHFYTSSDHFETSIENIDWTGFEFECSRRLAS